LGLLESGAAGKWGCWKVGLMEDGTAGMWDCWKVGLLESGAGKVQHVTLLRKC